MEDKLDYLDIASQIYTRLEIEYGWATPKEQDKIDATIFLASQLKRHTNIQVQAWNDALDLISNEGKEFPPKIPKLLKTMRIVARVTVEKETQNLKYLAMVNEQ